MSKENMEAVATVALICLVVVFSFAAVTLLASSLIKQNHIVTCITKASTKEDVRWCYEAFE